MGLTFRVFFLLVKKAPCVFAWLGCFSHQSCAYSQPRRKTRDAMSGRVRVDLMAMLVRRVFAGSTNLRMGGAPRALAPQPYTATVTVRHCRGVAQSTHSSFFQSAVSAGHVTQISSPQMHASSLNPAPFILWTRAQSALGDRQRAEGRGSTVTFWVIAGVLNMLFIFFCELRFCDDIVCAAQRPAHASRSAAERSARPDGSEGSEGCIAMRSERACCPKTATARPPASSRPSLK